MTPVHYNGIVWCVSVPTGAFVARRNGHVFITGNSGFPKATRIDTQIDKAAGAEREVVGQWKPTGTARPNKGKKGHSAKKATAADNSYDPDDEAIVDLTAPATPLAATWAGHRYGLQAMKPALEPIIVAQKPYAGRPVDSIVATGAGALWVDGGRISTNDNLNGGTYGGIFGNGKPTFHKDIGTGRWPPNFCLQHLPECKRVGTKRVAASVGGVKGKSGFAQGYESGEYRHYAADADGMETVEAWDCAPGCPVAAMDASAVGNAVIPCYNGETHKQEVSRCCEIASIAEFLSMQRGLMLREASGGSVAAPVASEHGASRDEPMPGDTSTNEVADGSGSGAKQVVEQSTASTRIDGPGNGQTGLSQKAMKSTTWTETKRITNCPTCGSSLLLTMTICTNGSGKPTESSRMVQRLGNARGAESTSPLTDSISVQQELFTDTARTVAKNTSGNGRSAIRTTTESTARVGANASRSRFFPRFDYALELLESLELPFKYTAKASRSERDAGLPDGERCTHPTVKPLSLCKWLATLLLPPPEYAPRRILVPFAGVASEMLGALLAGWDEIVGVEMEAEYAEIGRARLAHWAAQPVQIAMEGTQ